jgi:hypothetical protein
VLVDVLEGGAGLEKERVAALQHDFTDLARHSFTGAGLVVRTLVEEQEGN